MSSEKSLEDLHEDLIALRRELHQTSSSRKITIGKGSWPQVVMGLIGTAILIAGSMYGLGEILFVTKAEARAHSATEGHPIMIERMDQVYEDISEIKVILREIERRQLQGK